MFPLFGERGNIHPVLKFRKRFKNPIPDLTIGNETLQTGAKLEIMKSNHSSETGRKIILLTKFSSTVMRKLRARQRQ